MTSGHETKRQLVAALQQQAAKTGSTTPSVRGSDWRLATVTAVGAGTVTADGIVARCMPAYTAPAVGDVVVLDQSGSGSWLCWGPTAKSTPTWTPIPLASGWAATANYFAPAYRINGDGTASLCGMATGPTGTLASPVTVATLPAAARPAAQVRVTAQVGVGYFAAMTVATTGVISLGDYSAALPSTGQRWAEFDVLSRYRLT